MAAVKISATLMNSNDICVHIQVNTWKKLPVRILFQQQFLFLVRGYSSKTAPTDKHVHLACHF